MWIVVVLMNDRVVVWAQIFLSDVEVTELERVGMVAVDVVLLVDVEVLLAADVCC